MFILRGAGGVTAVAGGPEGLMVLELMVDSRENRGKLGKQKAEIRVTALVGAWVRQEG